MESTSASFAANHAPWHPSPDEVAGILAEMRPIIADFTRRAARFLEESSLVASEGMAWVAGTGAVTRTF